MFGFSLRNLEFEDTLRYLFTVSDANQAFKSHNITLVKPGPHIS
jgi:hypothetical protein